MSFERWNHFLLGAGKDLCGLCDCRKDCWRSFLQIGCIRMWVIRASLPLQQNSPGQALVGPSLGLPFQESCLSWGAGPEGFLLKAGVLCLPHFSQL